MAEDGAELTGGQVNALGKEKEALQVMHTTLNDLKSQADGDLLKDSIAPSILMKLKLAMGNLDGQQKLIDLTVEHKKGDVASIISENKVAKTEATATAKIMRAQLVVAKSLVKAPNAD